MGKHANVPRKYNKEWEKLPAFQPWLQKTPEKLLRQGKPEAYCSWCNTSIRAHKNDIMDHATRPKHLKAAESIPGAQGSRQASLLSHGFIPKSKESKIIDIKLAAHVACHSSIRTIDHLSDLMKELGTGSKLSELRIHRTKCSKIICKVIAPSLLKELVADIGQSWYSVIVDESTDVGSVKYLALIVRYFSFSQMKMISNFLGMVITPQATAEILYNVFKKFIQTVGLDLKHLLALGTDGALNLCGASNSLFAYLKQRDCPNLHLVKCICHSMDTSASKASKVFPDSLEFLLRESRNWFSHSALRKSIYDDMYQNLTGNTKPPQLVKLAKTRWLAWHGAVKSHLVQYFPLQRLFKSVAEGDPKEKCLMAHTLSELHEDKTHLLYLSFLNPILDEVASTNIVFQSSNADISKLYSDLKRFLFGLAARVIKPEALKQSQPGMLRLTELQALQIAIQRPQTHKPLELIDYGTKFWSLVVDMKIPEDKLRVVQTTCADFLIKLIHELTLRLPSCMDAVDKMRAFTPSVALGGKGRPFFKSLPLNMINDANIDHEKLESQWIKLACCPLKDFCPDQENIESVDIIEFWSGVYSLKNAAGKNVFGELGHFVLSCLSLPISNAVVERIFSILVIIKSKLRNKLGFEMLEAILRVRTHFQAHKICCSSFEPTEDMFDRFNYKDMYGKSRPAPQRAGVGVDEAAAEELAEAELDENETEHFSLVDRDLDDPVPIPAWEDMLNLVDEVDGMLSTL